MVEDFNALKTALENDVRYDVAVREGANGTLVTLLNAEDTAAAFVFDDVPVADVLEAAGQSRLATLIPDDRARLQVLKQSGEFGAATIATSKSAIRAELLDVFGITEAQLVAGVPAVRRRPKFGEAFGYINVSIADVRRAVRLIAKSFIVSTGQA